MLNTVNDGGYAFVPALPFASGGVVSLPGKTIVRAAFAQPVPLKTGFAAVERHLDGVRRPLSSLCGFELRMPAPLDWAGFGRFNGTYMTQLDTWKLLVGGVPPLARTNVAPTSRAPGEDSIAAFSYTEESDNDVQGIIVSGMPEMIAGATYPDNILRRGEIDPAALLAKTQCAAEAVRRTMDQLGVAWDPSCSVRLYSRWPLVEVLQREILSKWGIVPAHGIIWLDTDPPVFELELEIDARRHARELTIDVDGRSSARSHLT